MKTFFEFPQDFWWGAAFSGPQTEGNGGKPHENIMDYWYRIAPEDFHNQVGPDPASDFLHTYKEDLKAMKGMGMNSFRTSIQWSRLIDDLETGTVNEEGAAFYRDLIAEAKKNDLIPVLNLHHFDLPVELLEKYGGWQSRHVVDLFVRFASQCFALFGDEVDHWVTFNEPMVIPEAGYLYGHHYPRLQGHSQEAIQIMYNLNLASAKAIEAFRKSGKTGQIGIVCNLTPAYPKSSSKEDLKAAQFADAFFNDSFVQPALKGTFPQILVDTLSQDGMLWQSEPEDRQIFLENTADFLGINYYQPKRVQAPDPAQLEKPWMPERYFQPWQKPDARMNPYRGWEIYPKAIYDIAMRMKNDFPEVPWFISENGMGVEGEERFKDEQGKIDDQYRIDFYEEHLAWLNRAIQEGSRCFGFHAWTAFDCWSWNNAYKNRYGFLAVDLETQKRTPKASAQWLKELSTVHGFLAENPITE